MNNKIKIMLFALALFCALLLILSYYLNSVNKTLRNEFTLAQQQFEQEKQSLSKQLATTLETKKKLDVELGELRSKFDALTKDNNTLKERMDVVSKERATLVEKVQDLARQKKELEDQVVEFKKGGGKEGAVAGAAATSSDDAYWANVLREKASLELQVKSLGSQVTDLQLKTDRAMEEGRKIDMELKTVMQAREDLTRRLVYNEKLAETLSEDLVREKRDKKTMSDQFDTMRQENFELKSRLVALGDKKTSLESRLVDVQQEREILAKRLAELDQILQDRVDEIIKVKDDLKDVRTRAKEAGAKDSRVVQLQPIVVKAEEAQAPKGKRAGQVLAINEENNFVIVDLGEDDGAKIGQSLSIYRSNQKVATVEIIQTRKEISAADIKNVTPGAKIKIGDMVS